MVGTRFDIGHHGITDRHDERIAIDIGEIANPFMRRRKIVLINLGDIKQMPPDALDSIDGFIK